MQHNREVQTIAYDQMKRGGQGALLERIPDQELGGGSSPSAPLASSPLFGGRLLRLVVALLTVTLGMIGSVLFLSSSRYTIRSFPLISRTAALFHHTFLAILPITILMMLGSALLVFLLRKLTEREPVRGSHAFPPVLATFFICSKKRQMKKAPPVHSVSHCVLGEEQKRDWSQQAALEQSMIGVFAQALQLSREQVKMSSDFFQLGGDADSLVALLIAIEHHFQINLAPDNVFSHPVVFRLAAIIHDKQTATQKIAGMCA